jgi:hypothetical protein
LPGPAAPFSGVELDRPLDADFQPLGRDRPADIDEVAAGRDVAGQHARGGVDIVVGADRQRRRAGGFGPVGEFEHAVGLDLDIGVECRGRKREAEHVGLGVVVSLGLHDLEAGGAIHRHAGNQNLFRLEFDHIDLLDLGREGVTGRQQRELAVDQHDGTMSSHR